MARSSFRSIFPRTEFLYTGSRILVILLIGLWLTFCKTPFSEAVPVVIIGILFSVHTVVIHALAVKQRGLGERAFLGSLLIDIVLITVLVEFTGRFTSNFYLLYYLSVSLAAYSLGLQAGLLISFAITSFYTIIVAQSPIELPLPEMLTRLFLAWGLAFGTGNISNHMRQSESKLRKLLDTLNVRTTELEQSQVQIENIYSTSRMLGEILNLEQLLVEIGSIADRLWGYALFEIILIDPKTQGLARYTEVRNGKHCVFEPPEPIRSNGVIGRVAENGRPERIADVDSCSYYTVGLEGAKSELAVPMFSRGKMIGVINAESRAIGGFTKHDERLVSILAGSAALAVENARLHRQVMDLAIIDELTGTFNYRYFIQRFADEKKRAERYGMPLSLIMIDIDWFKRTNDTYGHEVGNIVLKDLARVVAECVRDTDQLCRYGGEEFVVLLPQTSSEDARQICDRVRERVDAHSFGGYGGAPQLHITVSIGTTSYPDNGLTTDDLLNAVDSALYTAKGSGKNQVAVV
jgi:diguanylate cyclase (GGDEF)-like protein